MQLASQKPKFTYAIYQKDSMILFLLHISDIGKIHAQAKVFMKLTNKM